MKIECIGGPWDGQKLEDCGPRTGPNQRTPSDVETTPGALVGWRPRKVNGCYTKRLRDGQSVYVWERETTLR